MKAQKVLAGIEYKVISGSADKTEIRGIEYDSRKVGNGMLFVCIEGYRVDGHDFAKEAYERGCRAFLCQRELDLPKDALQVLTKNTRRSLAYVSAAFYGYPDRNLTLIGITGTKGKTTTAVLIQSILNASGRKCGYIGSIGVRYGEHSYELNCTTPESPELYKILADMAAEGIEYVVIEVSSQALQNFRIASLKFDTCVFTNLSSDHIGPTEHLTFEDYRDAKKKLFTDYSCKNIIYNKDDPAAEYMVGDAKCGRISFSTIDREADYLVSQFSRTKDQGTLGVKFVCIGENEATEVNIPMPGNFNALNAVAAMATAKCFGVPEKQSAELLKEARVDGRFEIFEGPYGSTLVLDYAHNETSFKNALSTLREYNPTRIICVFGCVGERSKDRREQLGRLSAAMGDYSIFTSQNPNFESPGKICRDILSFYDKSKPYEIIIDRREAVKRAMEMARQGDVIFFAGKGHERYQLINGKHIPYDEKKEIYEAKKMIEK